MAKQYEEASTDVYQRIGKIREKYHPELGTWNDLYMAVTIKALFVFDDEKGQVLTHQGYGAAAVVKITSTKDRAAGLEDALLIVDRFVYSGLTAAQKDALIDHELYHLDRKISKKTGEPAFDSNGRPKLELRLHDHQIGAFDEIIARHREAALEVVAAKQLIAGMAQLSLPLEPRQAA